MPTAIPIPIPVNLNPLVQLALWSKAPADPQNFVISAAAWLAFFGRTIVGVPTIICTSFDLTISGISTSQGLIYFTVAGGNDLITYPLNLSASLDNGQSLTRTIYLPVQSNALNSSTPTIVSQGPPGPNVIVGGQTPVTAQQPALVPLKGSDVVLVARGGVVLATTFGAIVSQAKSRIPSTDYNFPMNASRRFAIGGI